MPSTEALEARVEALEEAYRDLVEAIRASGMVHLPPRDNSHFRTLNRDDLLHPLDHSVVGSAPGHHVGQPILDGPVDPHAVHAPMPLDRSNVGK